MAALTKDRETKYREGIEIEYPVAAAKKIFAGSLVGIDADGFATPAEDAAGFGFAGIAMEQVDNSAGLDGAKTIRLRRTGVFEFEALNLAQTMVGDPMYVSDDHTFTDAATAANDVKCGTLVKFVSATKGWIDIARY
jgi:hypothetical protein